MEKWCLKKKKMLCGPQKIYVQSLTSANLWLMTMYAQKLKGRCIDDMTEVLKLYVN